jgi:2-oxoglutarate dehydrogenase complex dehydrogenase (E1) component-like enzyme
MNVELEKEYMPTPDIACAYTSAMLFAQQLELNLRAILYTADYHGWGSEITSDMTPDQLKRFKNSDGFIDDATCGSLIEALKRTGIIKEAKKTWTAFGHACSDRNKLAHSFLAEQNLDGQTKQAKTKTITCLNEMKTRLRRALVISGKMRWDLEREADKFHESSMKEFCGSDFDNPNRHYSTRTKTKEIKMAL